MFFQTAADDGEVTLATAVGELAAANRDRGDRRQLPIIPPSLLVSAVVRR